MKEFFHGWRRRAGVVTLVMALALFGLWGRSLCIVDVVSVLQLDLQSAHGHLNWFADLSDEDAVYWQTYSFDPDWHIIRPGSPIVEWQFQVAGFGMGSITRSVDVGWEGNNLAGQYRMPKTNDFSGSPGSESRQPPNETNPRPRKVCIFHRDRKGLKGRNKPAQGRVKGRGPVTSPWVRVIRGPEALQGRNMPRHSDL